MIERGEIWWATLAVPRRSEPGFRRPVLVIQSDYFNRSRIATVIAIILSSNTRLADAPGNVLLKRRDTGLPKDSVANVSQFVTIDKSFLSDRVRAVSKRKLQEVEDGIRLTLAL